MSTAVERGARIHPAALCESDEISEGTRIWAHAHVLSGARIGRDGNVGDGAYIEGGARLGDRVTVKNGAMIWDGVTIEDDVFIGPGATFTNDRWPRSPRMPEAADRYRDPERWRVGTRVMQGASVGARAVILAGVTIGRYASVGAGAVVTRDVDPHQIVAGNPARPLGWACRCGARLDEAFACPACQRQFVMRKTELEELRVTRMAS